MKPRRNERLFSFPVAVALLALAGLALIGAYHRLWRGSGEPLVVYCAHDSVYSADVLDAFARATGIRVAAKYDTEATKSLGLTELIVSERANPRCDVFWNNELLGMLELCERGLLEPYKGPGYARIPAAFKDSEGRWTGFGARLRVYIVNTGHVEATPEAVRQALAGDLSHVAIAKPLYGTTLTQYSVLWERLGPEALKAWHADWRARGVVETTGNAQVKDLVAQGVCYVGLTDSDDYFVARDAGQPVAAVPVRLDDGGTICIPNTVAIIRGTRQAGRAQQLVDYLLSAECELALATSAARQVPLGPVDESALSGDMRELRAWAKDAVDLRRLGPARAGCIAWLKQEYAQ